jgi:hypothetical protein
MQQAISPISETAAVTGNNLPALGAAANGAGFVINLCASTTPVGLVQPSHPELKRFTFFVSRRREEGRERFRLHMGYFATQEAAEKMLEIVRDVYPAAWAGVAPGQRLRARHGATAQAQAQAHEPTQLAAPPAQAVATPAVPASAVPTLAVPARAIAPQMPAAPAPIRLELVPDLPRRTQPSPVVEMATATGNGAARSLKDIRATIASLGDAAVPAARGAQLPAASPLRVVTSPQESTPPTPVSARTPASGDSLADSQVLRVLESPARAPVRQPAAHAAQASGQAQPAGFAVQLLWSVQPIDMGEIPQLAIFAAYTLYGAEGNRDGRRWFGLRLGFFTDAASAKQVAQYVRSEFKSVSVVPVSERERSSANAATARQLPPVASARSAGHDLNFIEDVPTDTATSGSRPALQVTGAAPKPAARAPAGAPAIATTAPAPAPLATAVPAAGAAVATRGPPGKRAKLRVAQGTRPVSKRPAHSRPLSLEETLEVLGASALKMEEDRGERVNDDSTRDRVGKAAKARNGSRFGRLMDRLAERFGS